MPIDSNIALGYRAPQFESPLAQAAQSTQLANAQQQNILGQMQMAEMGRAAQQKNQMREILSGANAEAGMPQINALLEKAYIQSGDIPGLMAHRKMVAEAETTQLKRDELKGKLAAQPYELSEKQSKAVEAKLGQVKNLYQTLDPNDPNVGDKYLSIHNSVHDDPLLGPLLNKMGVKKEDSITDINRAATTPGGMKDLINRSIMGTQKFMEFTAPKTEKVDTGGKVEFRDLNPNSPTFGQLVGPKSITKTATIGETESARHNKKTEGIQAAELKLKQERELRDKDPAFQQAMAGAKAKGEAIAKGDVAAVQALPRILDRADRAINLIDEMVGKQEVRDKSGKVIQKGTAPHPGFESAVGAAMIPYERLISGSPAADFQSRFEEIKGGAFLEAFESLKGAGSISEKEGEKATTAITRMSLAQSEKEFMAAARDLQDVVRKGVANAKNRAAQAGSTPNIDAILNKYP